MEQNALNETFALWKRNLCSSLRQLMNQCRSVRTFRHYSWKVITASVPRYLFYRFEMIQDKPFTFFVSFTFGRRPLNSCFDSLTFEDIYFGRFDQNFVRFLGQNVIANFWIQQNQSLATSNGNQRNLCVWTPSDRTNNVACVECFDASTGWNFPNWNNENRRLNNNGIESNSEISNLLLTVLSSDPDTMYSPFGSMLTDRMMSVWPM